MVPIDTSKVFDTIDRQVLLEELKSAGADANDIAIIMTLHSNIGCHPRKSDPEARIMSLRGVRQGCALAPTLRALITIALMKAMGDQAGPSWVRDSSTPFADDLLLRYEFNSKYELDRMLPNLARCLAILKSIGLQVQCGKTQVILAGRGRQFKLWRKKHARKTKDSPRLLLWSATGQSLQTPIVTSATYLGIKLCVSKLRELTLAHRLAAAKLRGRVS